MIPSDQHPTVQTFEDQEGEAAVLIADGETIGGGVVDHVGRLEGTTRSTSSSINTQWERAQTICKCLYLVTEHYNEEPKPVMDHQIRELWEGV